MRCTPDCGLRMSMSEAEAQFFFQQEGRKGPGLFALSSMLPNISNTK